MVFTLVTGFRRKNITFLPLTNVCNVTVVIRSHVHNIKGIGLALSVSPWGLGLEHKAIENITGHIQNLYHTHLRLSRQSSRAPEPAELSSRLSLSHRRSAKGRFRCSAGRRRF